MLYLPKSQPAPECLASEKAKENGDYKCGCVVERLAKDFLNKCYICELSATTLNVEHFVAHQDDKELKFDWQNLFLACGHCNNCKLALFNNLLNCTTDSEIEQKLRYHFSPFPGELVKIDAIEKTDAVEQTKNLIEKVFNGEHTPLKRLENSNLRNQLLKEIQRFQRYLTQYFEYTTSDEDKQEYLLAIKKDLHPAANFVSFKRWIIRNNSLLKEEFGQLI